MAASCGLRSFEGKLGTTAIRKLQSFRDMLVVASDRWRRTRNRRTCANLPTSACASAISSISGVGKSLRAPAAQFLGASLAARPSGGGYRPAALAKECVRWIEADQPQSAFKADLSRSMGDGICRIFDRRYRHFGMRDHARMVAARNMEDLRLRTRGELIQNIRRYDFVGVAYDVP